MAGEDATLVDFGLVSEDHHATLSRPGALFGTLRYVPPEWGGAERPDGAAWDRYSLGVLLYELFTATPAFPCPANLPFDEQLARTHRAKAAHPHLDPGPSHAPEVRQIVRLLSTVDPSRRHCDLGGAAEVLRKLRERLPPEVAAQKPAGQPPTASASQPTWDSVLEDQLDALHSGGIGGAGAPTAVPEWSVVSDLTHDDATEEEEGTPTAGRTLVPEVDDPAAPAPPRTSGWAKWAVGAGLLAMTGLGVALLAPPAEPPPPERWPLRLHLSPPEPALPVRISLDGVPVELADPPELSAGAHELRVVMGDNCDGEAVPVHCAELRESFSVGWDGLGAERRLRLPEVVPQSVTLRPSPVQSVRVRLDEGEWTTPDDAPVLHGLKPGVYGGVVQAGDCPEEPCGAGCPPVCREATVHIVVPFLATGELAVSVALAVPQIPPAGAPKKRIPPLFSVARFTDWLTRNPSYQREAATASGLASARYLRGWAGTSPPEKLASGAAIQGSTPVEAVSPEVAARACRGRGGLRSVDAAPRSWAVPDGGPVPWFEIRQSDAGPVLLQNDGTVIPVKATDARPMVGFRCAR